MRENFGYTGASRWTAFSAAQKGDSVFHQLKSKPFQSFSFRVSASFSLSPPLLLPLPPVWTPSHKGENRSEPNANRPLLGHWPPPTKHRGRESQLGGREATGGAHREQKSGRVPTPHTGS